jgi:probable DNA metabolism protein
MSTIYVYDGTFSGLLTVISRVIQSDEEPESITSAPPLQGDLFISIESVATEDDRALRLASGIREKASEEAFRNCIYAFLAEERDCEKQILAYVRKALILGAQVDSHHCDDDVIALHRSVQRISTECHRLKGFIRFEQLEDGLLYAPIEPVHNVARLLAPHFARRLSTQRWAIHDRKRQVAVLFEKGRWETVDVLSSGLPELSVEEKEIQRLWKAFYDSVNIRERANPRLQRRMMPERYWKYLPELNVSPERGMEKGRENPYTHRHD